jgi:hypothetical protein
VAVRALARGRSALLARLNAPEIAITDDHRFARSIAISSAA